MLLYICTCLVFLGVVKFSQVKSIEPTNDRPNNDAPKQADAIFADVIKNISRVNNVLQELINNYEQLQKIYKSQENVDSVYSDSEIDEVFKSKNSKQAKRMKDKTVTLKPNSNFPATQMFWSDHDEDQDNDDSNDSTDKKKDFNNVKETVKKNNTSELTNKPKNSQAIQKVNLKRVAFSDSSDESSDSSLSVEKVKKHKEKVKNKPERNKYTDTKLKQSQAQLIFVDPHVKKQEKVTPMRLQVVTPKQKVRNSLQFAGVPTKLKTRYSKVSHNQVNSELQAPNSSPKGANDTRKVKKIVHAETFSPKKIWNDIINNTPIQLQAHNEITLRRVDKVKKKNHTEFNNRSKNGKSAIVIVTKNKEKGNKDKISSDDDDTTIRDQLKTNVLRQAYGDACLKLVLRKCYKACKRVPKVACDQVKCKSAAKTTFKTHSKTGCINEFQGGEDKLREKNSPDPVKRGQQSEFLDMTRGGFLSAACLPHLEGHKDISLRNDTPHQTNEDKQFNILRDSFERACKKISFEKCNKACTYATKMMCDTNECSKRMKKMFKKTCKSQCKSAYKLRKDSDSESDSDDSGDSESSDTSELESD